MTHEALHHAAFKFSGPVRVFDTTGDTPQKIYPGQQLVLFGRYEGAGKSTVTLRASLSGEYQVYTTTIDLPEIDLDHPEIERLWAMALIEQIEARESAGLQPATESRVTTSSASPRSGPRNPSAPPSRPGRHAPI